ncbi:MAG: hypothetical protein QM783_04640 [Phycisphaerales bacterium]
MTRTRKALVSAVVLSAFSTVSLAALQATGELVGTPMGGGVYHYTLTIHNTGTTTIGSLWFAWIPGENFMTAAATSVTSPANWAGAHQGGAGADSVLWQANSAAARIAVGGTLTGFAFNSTQTPAQMAALSPNDTRYHMTDSYVYSAGAFSDGGFLFTITVTPTPSAAAALGLASTAMLRRRTRSHT